MRTIKIMAAALLALVLGATAMASQPEQPGPPIVYVMRHLDTPEGQVDPDLTEQGAARAQTLVKWFSTKPLTAIFASNYKRTIQTAAPVAYARGVPIYLYNPADTRALVARVKAQTGAVLIVGHSNTVPGIVEQFGGPRPAPLAHSDFGDIWTVADGMAPKDKLP